MGKLMPHTVSPIIGTPTDLAVLYAASQHDNSMDLILPHHFPEPVHCDSCWTCRQRDKTIRTKGKQDRGGEGQWQREMFA